MGDFGLSDNAVILRVLLIEAEPRDAERLLDALRGGGHTVYSRCFARRAEVEGALANESWDIVLLSCRVPELPPEEAIDLLRDQAPQTPVILTVERGAREFPMELLDAGASDFVFKSNPARLLALIERECARNLLHDKSGLAKFDSSPGKGINAGEMRFFQLASNIPECYWLVDAETQRVTYVSKAYEQIWGRYVEALYADNLDWLKYIHPDDRAHLLAEMRKHRLGGMDVKFRVSRPGDGLRWLHARNFPVCDEQGRIVSIGGVAGDITSLLVEQRKTPYFAHFDALTALPNQLMFYDQARRLIALAKRKDMALGLMVVDIDRFREINQTLGHNSGDELLRQFAGRLSGTLRDSDILGRLNGDTFAVLLPDIADQQQAAIVARRVIDTLIQPVRVEGQDVFTTASLGIVFYPQDGHDPHELVSNAEVAVRHAKSAGRNNYQCYSSEMHEGIRDRLFLETDLRNATLNREFVLYYQPKVSCVDGRMTGAEALIRWQHPRRGLVPPDQFIALLEETGLIVQVGRWVLKEACRQALAWQREGLNIPSISVNLSARQLQSDTLLDDIAATLAETGLKPACLDLEITESMLMQNADSAIRTLSALKQMGVTISLDDFGTGYSSLAYLKRFPLDTIKVDRSFVQDITADSDDASITRAVITMAHHLKLKVVAEGVETSAQLALLISHQCDIIQGYFFSRPLPAASMHELLVKDKHLPARLLRSGTRKPMALFVGVTGFDDEIASLIHDGHRICQVADIDAARQWFAGNLADLLVCCAPRRGFDAGAIIRLAAETQPQCERIVVADNREWARKEVVDLSSSGCVDRVIHLPIDPATFRRIIAESLGRRHISDEYNRLSHAVDIAERELVRAEAERRRLAAENQLLLAQENTGYQVLREVIAELPWPVLGIDNDGCLALINDAAFDCFAGLPLAPGMRLENILPALSVAPDGAAITLGKRQFVVCWRPFRLGQKSEGRLLFLEGK